MSANSRIAAIRLIEKIEKNKAYSEAIGISNESTFRGHKVAPFTQTETEMPKAGGIL